MAHITTAAEVLLDRSASAGDAYYVDFTDGIDTNPGTKASPWKTIPGTRNTADNGDQSTSWGNPAIIDSSNKVQPGTIIYLKGGTTHDKNNGGKILIDSDYYSASATVANPIKIWKDLTWGAGTVTIDGTDVVVDSTGTHHGHGLIHITVGGVEIDGKEINGITIQDSFVHGISFYSNTDGIAGITLKYLKTVNCGAHYTSDSDAAASGHISIRSASGGSASYINMDGVNKTTGYYSNGMLFGSDNPTRVYNFTVSNCNAYNLRGDVSTDDAGIGFKGFNSSVTLNDCTSYDNLKGMDFGQQGSPTWDFTYMVNRAKVYNNVWGVNFNGVHGAYAYNIKFYIMNSIIYDNSTFGSQIYSGPYNLYMVHNVYHGNGSGGSYNSGNITIGPDTGLVGGLYDTLEINAYVYNNCFYKTASDEANYQNKLWRITTGASDFSFYSDYNSWIQNDAASDEFAYWGANAGSEETTVFSYGVNGPGHNHGIWYTYYGGSTTEPSTGCIGHYNQDYHSYATGGGDSTPPPFTDAANHDYTLTTNYVGTDLSGQPWYISEMGIDRNGVTRTSWDVGAYEHV